ncbi:MAG: hypothetical protein JWM53_3993 [bacterium]|nr:hypothetical protein [bacterium]
MRFAVAVMAVLLVRSAAAEDTMQHAQRVRRAGIGFSIAGVGCEIATVALWGAAVGIIADTHTRCGEYCSDPRAYWPVAGLAIATSAAVPLLLVIGIPMWAIGSHRVNALKARRVSLTPTGAIVF